MLAKTVQHKKAILLRKKGYSYSEIAAVINVSQASLSLWLRNVELTQLQMDNLLLKRKNGQAKGAKRRRDVREQQQKTIIETAAQEIDNLSKKELFLLGTVAYWCEGSKQKAHNVSQCVVFANSDPFLIKLFIKWLKEICLIKKNDIKYSLHIHETGDTKRAIEYWCKTLNITTTELGRPILKRHRTATTRKNVGKDYYGLIRIVVGRSTNLNRKIAGWIVGINQFIN